MTKRERFLSVLNKQKSNQLVWSPNFDYWYHINRLQKTLPDKFKDMTHHGIVREIDAYLWHRIGGLKGVVDNSVKFTSYDKGDDTVFVIDTPIGSIHSIQSKTESEFSTKAVTKHYVNDFNELEIMKYVIEATSFVLDSENIDKSLQIVGDEGIVLSTEFCVPFISFAKTDVGYMNAYYMWTDDKQKVNDYVNAYMKQYLGGI